MTDYLDWQSSISLEQVFASAGSFSYPELFSGESGDLIYLTVLKEQKSRAALMLQGDDGGDAQCITPREFSLRTKVNEYGGKPFWLFDTSAVTEIVFANQADQCLYRQTIDGRKVAKPARITATSDGCSRQMYTDVNRLGDDCYLTIVESESLLEHAKENTMSIMALTGAAGPSNILNGLELISGADFYSNLVVSKDAKRVAWVQWNHPGMPWDETALWIADIDTKNDLPELTNVTRVSLNMGASVCQLMFSKQGSLFFSADFPASPVNKESDKAANFWNVYCYQFTSREVVQVTDLQREFGYPHWVYGDHRIAQVNNQELIAIGSGPEGDNLYLINVLSLQVRQLSSTNSTVQHLNSNGKGTFVAECLDKDDNPKLIQGTLVTTAGLPDQQQVEPALALRERIGPSSAPNATSIAEQLSYKTRDGSQAHGFFYPPNNPNVKAADQSAKPPPLIVMVHGGPTARAYGHFDIQKQFWTSRGFAIFDVNHRGSSGYGREYRDALYDHWGERDAADIIDGIEMLIDGGKIDRERVCIRGKSAGGYAVLRALTEYPDYFKAGACYYGIGNLVTLAEATHKFEKYYTDRLLGESYKAESAVLTSSLFYQRSPIHKMDQVTSAMIIFQGSLDKVVPASVAQEVVDVLKKAQVEHAYVEYDDEGHGFRQVANNIDAWTKELEFYQRVLRSA